MLSSRTGASISGAESLPKVGVDVGRVALSLMRRRLQESSRSRRLRQLGSAGKPRILLILRLIGPWGCRLALITMAIGQVHCIGHREHANVHPEFAKYQANVPEGDLAPSGQENDHQKEVKQVEEHCPHEVPAIEHLYRPLVVAFVLKLIVCHFDFKLLFELRL